MNVRNRTKVGCVAVAIYAAALCEAVEPATWNDAKKPENTITYDNNGSGGWNSTSRWVGNTLPGPQNSVKIYNAKNVVIRDEDLNVFTNVYWYTIDNKSVVTIDCTNDVVFPGCFRAGNKSTIVKVGTNRFEFATRLADYCMYTASRYVVSNGCVRFGKPYYYENCTPVLEVWKPGVAELYTEDHSHLLGIAGDGLVTNTSSSVRQLRLWSQRTNGVLGYGPWTFSGTIGNKTKIIIGVDDRNPDSWGTQYFMGTNNVRKSSSNNAIIINHGFVGVEEPGLGAGSATSVPGYIYQMYGATNATMPDTGFIYLGKGGRTDMRIDYYNRYGKSQLFIDGGAHGGLVFVDGTGTEDHSGKWRNLGEYYYKECGWASAKNTSVTAERFILTGSNTTACVISNTIVEGTSVPFICFIKRGKGTWRFAERPSDMCNNKGPILVEQGRLEFDSFTALGTGTKPFTNFWEDVEQEDTRVQYIYRIGNGTNDAMAADLPTMAYLGAGLASSTRKFAVCGAGRIENGPEAGGLSLSGGVFSDCEGTNTLVLAGPGNNSLTHVTNAIGTLSVVKEDAGRWELFGTVRIADAEVKAGDLVFDGHAICPSLKVDGGASLFAETWDLQVDHLRFDAAKGAGAVTGAVFAVAGEFRLDGVGANVKEIALGGDFSRCTGLSNVTGWTLLINGEPNPKYVLGRSGNGFTVCRRGMVVLFR